MKDNALYLEVDEDITSAIDKLTKTPGSSVQIVVPKRSTMLQSIINLKLLKKAAEAGGKELILVTNDRVAGDLASRVGLATAPSLGAKPVIREAELPAQLAGGDEIIDADDPEPPPTPPEPKVSAKRLLVQSRDVSDGPPAEAAPALAAAELDESAGPAPATSPKKGPRVPNFHRLQRRVMWIGLALVLVGGYMLGMFLFATAKVTLYANGTKIDIDTNFAVDPSAKTTDTAGAVLAGQVVTESKDLAEPFTPTGKQDVGTKAGGTMTIYNSGDTGTQQTLQSGTRFVAPDGKLFRSTADVTVNGASIKNKQIAPGTATVNVTADQNGDSYNEAPAAYTIPGLGSQSTVTASGAQMSGGTTKTVTVVAQSDVDTAKADLLTKDKDNSTRDLKGRLPSGYVSIDASSTSSVTSVQPAPAVGAAGDTGNLTIKVTYTVLAVKSADYSALVEAQELKQIGDTNQIYQNGIDTAQVSASDRDSSGRQTFHFTTEAFGGAKLDKTAIAKSLAGKRFGDASDLANRLPGISSATISLLPAWSTTLPGRPGKIQITIQVAASK